MRSLEIRCDNCGTVKPLDVRPRTWWELEQSGAVLTTGVLDFCSLRCLANWVESAEVQMHEAYREDFRPGDVTTDGV